MIRERLHSLCKFQSVLLLLLLLFPARLIFAQSDPDWEIAWVGQFPDEESKQKKSLGNRLSEVVFGKKTQEVIKPFNILAGDPDHYLILDQGSGGIIKNSGGKAVELKAMKRTAQLFPSLVGMTSLPDGEVLLTDSRLNQVFQLTEEKLSFFSDALAFNQPTGIAYSEKTDEIWIVETGAHRITLVDREGNVLRTLGERGSAEGSFNYPTFIWIDSSGKVYIVDSMNFRIQVFDPGGAFLFAFGENGDASGYMARPKGVATDSRGHIYVADALFHVVQIFDAEGNFLHSFGTQGQGEGEFWMPAGIYVDSRDHIYVADSYNSRVQVFQLVKN